MEFWPLLMYLSFSIPTLIALLILAAVAIIIAAVGFMNKYVGAVIAIVAILIVILI